MRTETITKEIFTFEELSEQAREVAKQWYLDGQDSSSFTEDVKETLQAHYGLSSLETSYSLGYSQGDGLCLHGTIDIIKELLENEKMVDVLKGLTEEQKEILKRLAEIEGADITFDKFTHHYSHSNTVRIEYNLYIDETEEEKQTIEVLLKNLQEWYFKTCKEFEEEGYAYFYEISDEDLKETCEANDYEFTEDGKIYH